MAGRGETIAPGRGDHEVGGPNDSFGAQDLDGIAPGILDTLELAAVGLAAEEFQCRTGIKCRLDLPNNVLQPEHNPSSSLLARHSAIRLSTPTLRQSGSPAHSSDWIR